MNFNRFLLTSSFMALMILPACNWFENKPEAVVIEEIIVIEPEMESLQDQQVDDQELNDLSLLPDSEK